MTLSRDKYVPNTTENVDKIVYYHGHHSNPCVVGEVFVPQAGRLDKDLRGFEVIIITHDILCKDYGDNLSDITKVWDSQTHSEACNSRFDTNPDKCIHIPLDMEDDTSLSNQVLKQVLVNNGVQFVKFSTRKNLLTIENFFTKCLGL